MPEVKREGKKAGRRRAGGKRVNASLHNAPTLDPKAPILAQVKAWIPAANLLLTLILGVYLSVSSGNLQKQIVRLQNQIQYAHLAVKSDCENSFKCKIRVANIGPSAATNLRIVVVVRSINGRWKNDLKDISSVEIGFDNPSFKYEVTNEKIEETANDTTAGLNAKLIIVKSLPPEATVSMMPILTTEPYVVDSTATLLIESPTPAPSSYSPGCGHACRAIEVQTAQAREEASQNLYEHTMTFIKNVYNVADLRISVSCENCSGDVPELTYMINSLQDITPINGPLELGISDKWVFKTKLSSNDPTVAPLLLETSIDPEGSKPIVIDLLSP